MAIPALARDFKEFMKSLNSNSVEYLLIGVISLARLRENKAASGRAKDLADLENLPA